MKKIICLTFAFILAFVLFSCGECSESKTDYREQDNIEHISHETETETTEKNGAETPDCDDPPAQPWNPREHDEILSLYENGNLIMSVTVQYHQEPNNDERQRSVEFAEIFLEFLLAFVQFDSDRLRSLTSAELFAELQAHDLWLSNELADVTWTKSSWFSSSGANSFTEGEVVFFADNFFLSFGSMSYVVFAPQDDGGYIVDRLVHTIPWSVFGWYAENDEYRYEDYIALMRRWMYEGGLYFPEVQN